MSYKNVVISSGHGLYVRGASGTLDEVDEARKVTESVAEYLRAREAQVVTFHDDTSTSQNENLETIVAFHNSCTRQLDISVHFNAYVACSGPMGCEVLYKSQSTLSTEMSKAMAEAGGFINRGAKKRTDLFFLNQTQMPAILLECCFVDSTADAELYNANYEAICEAVAATLKHKEGEEPPKPSSVLVDVSGKCSHFGGPEDEGVSPSEGLAFIQDIMEAPHLFLPYQPEGTTGLARRLNPEISYVACRWNYDITPPEMLLAKKALIRVPGGAELTAFPADWGPHSSTGRIADLSPRLFDVLKLKTDDEVEVIFPA